jgi:hypothetical protein
MNLLYHLDKCSGDHTPTALYHHLFAGAESLYGQKEDLGGHFGDDFRFMFMVGATK